MTQVILEKTTSLTTIQHYSRETTICDSILLLKIPLPRRCLGMAM